MTGKLRFLRGLGSSLLALAQDGTSDVDGLAGAAVGDDGSIVLAGYTNGIWDEIGFTNDDSDFAAVKLRADGAEVWRWQVNDVHLSRGLLRLSSD